MVAVYGNNCPSYGAIMRWKRNFQSGQMFPTDEPRPGRSLWTYGKVIVKKVECLILEERPKTWAWNGSMSNPLLQKRQRCKRQQERSCSQSWSRFSKGTNHFGTYYSNLLDKLLGALKNKHRSMLSRGILLLTDNAQEHMLQLTKQGHVALWSCSIRLKSPDLAPNDFLLFP